jgi:hypothetical protein
MRLWVRSFSGRLATTRALRPAFLLAAAIALGLTLPAGASPARQTGDPEPPDRVVRLVFIHHSTGENWLRDDYGGLGRALAENNYFVSDTNYGWGPDSIGDRTDIPDWLEWFRGDDSAEILQALYREGEPHSDYARPLPDPGGENEIILLKSCFPNSNLEGRPGDPPASEAGYSVGGAKYVYNQLLEYFRSRPDRLFVVITAPPVSDPTYAANARAFNDWLVHDWLQENGYPYANVAVFDFYDVLTGPDHHHRFSDGEIEHVYQPGHDTAFYPASAGDDHPSVAGSRRATEEFLPLLNVFYNRWRSNAPAEAPAAVPSVPAASPAGPGLIDDFETGSPAGTEGWVVSSGEVPGTHILCRPSDTSPRSGSLALTLDFSVPAGSWATCILPYTAAQDWSAAAGVLIPIHGDRAGVPYSVLLFGGPPDNPQTYISHQDTPTDSVGGWAMVEVPWDAFHRVDWEDDPGAAFDQPDQVVGIGFGFDGLDAATNDGLLQVDDLSLIGAGAAPEVETQSRGLPCPTAPVLAVLLPAATLLRRKPREASGHHARGLEREPAPSSRTAE